MKNADIVNINVNDIKMNLLVEIPDVDYRYS